MKKLERTLRRAGEREQVINAEIFFAGIIAVFNSEKLHKFVSGAMVIFTTMSLVAIAESKLYKIDFPFAFVLPMALAALLVYAYFFSDFAEDGKISLIRTSLFSSGWNQIVSVAGMIFVIAALIIINYFGVIAGADFSKRFLDKKLMQSEAIVLQKNNLNLLSRSVGQGDFSTYENQISDLRSQKADMKKSLKSFISSKDPKKYATQIQRETRKMMKSIAIIDWKISKLLREKSAEQRELNQHNQNIINQSISATKSLQNNIEVGQEINQNLVNSETSWALKIAIGGEILDGFFIFLFLFLHRTNPSTEYIPSLKRGTRKEYIDINTFKELETKKEDSHDFIKLHEKKDSTQNQRAFSEKKNNTEKSKSHGKVTLSDEKYFEIKEVSDRYQEDEKHLSRRELIRRFEDVGKSIVPSQIALYFARREKEKEIYRPSKNGRYEYITIEETA